MITRAWVGFVINVISCGTMPNWEPSKSAREYLKVLIYGDHGKYTDKTRLPADASKNVSS